MMAMNRTNPRGLRFYMEEIPNTTRTRIKAVDLDREVVVDHTIQRMSQGWYNWQVEGDYIQNAFDFLTASEREFLQTGLTEAEWDDLFFYVRKEGEEA